MLSSWFYQVEHVLTDRLLHFVDVDLHDVKVLCIANKKNNKKGKKRKTCIIVLVPANFV